MSHLLKTHFSQGGDGVTNFDLEDLPIYMEAVKKHGDSDLWISQQGFDGDRNLGSLRCKRDKELSSFWKVFDEVAKQHGGMKIHKWMEKLSHKTA